MTTNRAERLAEAIRQEAAEIVEFELLDDRLTSVTITEVVVSQDLRHAKVYVDINGEEQEISVALKALEHASGFVRHQLAMRLQIKRVPELIFRYDDTMKKALRIEQILEEEKEREKLS
ncbi:MAG: 30S ribosome-binding factor RbfA [Blastocatellia bacterium]|nr:30S ribosome-binding factor RbfA [Blastocatellia bacterium]